MFKSVADRLGIPHSTSSSSISSHHSSGSSLPTSSSASHHRTSIFSSAPSTRSPSRQQQHNTKYTTSITPTYSKPISHNVSRKTATPMPAPTPMPVLPPLSFFETKDENLALSVANAGVDPNELPSRAAENVIVSVRVRPFSVSELKVAGGPTEVWAVQDGSRIGYSDDYSMRDRRTAVDYSYDHALTGSDNELIYNTSVKDLVKSAMEGYN
ncbi:hypothetical protein BGZ76_006676, partial [Entomortierella beljakovae]